MSGATWDQVEHGGRLADAIWNLDPSGTLSRQDARVIADGLIDAGYRPEGGVA